MLCKSTWQPGYSKQTVYNHIVWLSDMHPGAVPGCRSAANNCCYALEKSLLMDYVRKVQSSTSGCGAFFPLLAMVKGLHADPDPLPMRCRSRAAGGTAWTACWPLAGAAARWWAASCWTSLAST